MEKQIVEENKIINASQQEIIDKTVVYVKETLGGEASGHDWWHAYRVWKLAKKIGKTEKADPFVVQLGALLHDIADWKFHDGNETVGPETARKWLEGLHVDENIIGHVCQIIKNISFKGAGIPSPMKTVEGKVVQDADRIDAIGAIGVARCFAYGGATGVGMHDPEQAITLHQSAQAYKNNKSTSLNHFYEKLFLVKERINTKAGLAIAEKRHDYMETFVDTFLNEWKAGAGEEI